MYRYIVDTSLDKRDLRLFRVLLLFNIFKQSGAQEGRRIPQNLVCLVRWGCSSVLNDVRGGLLAFYMFKIVLMMVIQQQQQQPSPANKRMEVCLTSFWLNCFKVHAMLNNADQYCSDQIQLEFLPLQATFPNLWHSTEFILITCCVWAQACAAQAAVLCFVSVICSLDYYVCLSAALLSRLGCADSVPLQPWGLLRVLRLVQNSAKIFLTSPAHVC